METIAVIDFETTGMSPQAGARATEVAIVLVQGDRIVDRFQGLMNAGAWIPPFIESLTGITNEMIAAAPPAEAVMSDAARFVGAHPLVAHNAAFDRKFWIAELGRAGHAAQGEFACTLLLARRLYPDAPDHKLGTLRRWAGLRAAGRHHRALADAEVAAQLLARIRRDLVAQWGLAAPTHAMLRELQDAPRHRFAQRVAELAR